MDKATLIKGGGLSAMVVAGIAVLTLVLRQVGCTDAANVIDDIVTPGGNTAESVEAEAPATEPLPELTEPGTGP